MVLFFFLFVSMRGLFYILNVSTIKFYFDAFEEFINADYFGLNPTLRGCFTFFFCHLFQFFHIIYFSRLPEIKSFCYIIFYKRKKTCVVYLSFRSS